MGVDVLEGVRVGVVEGGSVGGRVEWAPLPFGQVNVQHSWSFMVVNGDGRVRCTRVPPSL